MNRKNYNLLDKYEMSHGQKRIWFHDQLDYVKNSIGKYAYNLILAIKLEGLIHVENINKAMQQIIERHDIFRTTYDLIDGVPYQIIHPQHLFQLEEVCIGDMTENQVIDMLQESRNVDFNLKELPLLKLKMFKLKDNEYIMSLVIHHIIFDGWSSDVFFNELFENYFNMQENIKNELNPLSIQYYDFAHWQNYMLSNNDLEGDKNYWMDQFSGDITDLGFPLDYPRGLKQNYLGDSVDLEFSSELTLKIQQFCHKHKMSINNFLMSCLVGVLHIYTKNDEIIVGTSFSGRTHPDTKPLIGCFINTVPLKFTLKKGMELETLIKMCNNNIKQGMRHQDYPFDALLEELKLERDLSKNPIFTTTFQYHSWKLDNKYLDNDEGYNGIKIKSINLRPKVSLFDFSFELFQRKENIQGYIQFATSVLSKHTINKLKEVYTNYIDYIVSQNVGSIAEINVVSAEDRRLQLEVFNNNKFDFNNQFSVKEIIEDRATSLNNKEILTYNGNKYSFGYINERANQIAHLLIKLGCKRNTFVAILKNRDEDYIISALAILKAGGAYLPIDVNIPKERLDYILQDSGVSLIISESNYMKELIAYQQLSGIVCLDKSLINDERIYDLAEIKKSNTENTDVKNNHKDYAYMIYTSGSTGKPKGALVTQQGMLNHLFSKVKDIDIKEEDVVLQSAAVSFDIHVWQVFVPLIKGCYSVIMPTNILLETEACGEFLWNNKITILQFVPSVINLLIDHLEKNKELCLKLEDSLKKVLSIGAELPKFSVEKWYKLFNKVKLVNSYGPTEASDTITHYHIVGDDYKKYNRTPLGKSLFNTNIYILDENNKLLPVGVTGEICVSGPCVGGGYWNNPELTSQKFIKNEFSDDPNHSIIYKTGDVGSWCREGLLHFYGRNDNQVKVRGHRIELEEIEANILKYCSQIRETAVIVKQNEELDNVIVAFYVSTQEVSINEIKTLLQKELPAYMIPSFFVKINKIPMLASGKINRQQLKKEKIEIEPSSVVCFDEELTSYEEEIKSIWQNEIKFKVVIHKESNFFEVGGHSILGVKVINKLREKYNINLPLQDLFDYPTLSAMASRVEELATHGTSIFNRLPIKPIPVAEKYELAAIQLPEWYLYELEPNSSFYNVNQNLILKGELSLEAFHNALKYMVDRHKILRVSFSIINNKPHQLIKDSIDLDLDNYYKDKTCLSPTEMEESLKEEIFSALNTIFDLREGPLFKFSLVKYDYSQWLFSLVTHHIIWDEVSTINFLNELVEVYNAYSTGIQPDLVPLTIDYFDYAHWLNNSVEEGHFDEYKKFWLDKYAVLPEPLELPTDYPRPAIQTFNGATEIQIFSKGLRYEIEEYCRQKSVTPYMFFLSVLYLQLYKITGNKDIVVGSPIVNRDEENLEKLLGLFTVGIPLRCGIQDDDLFIDLLSKVKNETIQTYDNHFYPINYIIEKIQVNNDLSRSKLFNIMFGVQNDKGRMLDDLKFNGMDVEMKILDFHENSSRFDITLAIDIAEDFILNLNYNTDLFKQSTAKKLINQYVALIKSVLEEDSKGVNNYSVLSEEERSIIDLANRKEDRIDHHITVIDKIDELAKENPNQAIVRYFDEDICYKDLVKRANELSHYIINEYGIGIEGRVGMVFEPSIDCIITILAILKAGAAYVPMGIDYPQNRIETIIKKAEIKLLITSTQVNIEELEDCRSFKYSSDMELGDSEGKVPERKVKPDNLAYIIFTSGSTGEPKGIGVEHKGMSNLFNWTHKEYPLTKEDSVLFITPYTFDVSILDILFPLTVGVRIVIASEEDRRTPSKIGQLAVKENISLLQFVPDMLSAFVDSFEAKEFSMPTNLKHSVCAGGILTRKLANRFMSIFPTCTLSNHYGPTEASVDSTSFRCENDYEGDVVPIGVPVANTKIHILDANLQQVPIGMPGEICIESIGLAREYINDLGQTNKAFIMVDIPGHGRVRVYRTGDIAKYLEDGNLVFIGRKDNQIKIRGNRVELEEIENKINSIRGIKSEAVIYHKDSISAFVELEKKNCLTSKEGESLYIYTLAQLPDKISEVHQLNREIWPEYFNYNEASTEYWPRLFTDFLDYQIVILTEKDEIVAVGNTVPIYWNGKDENLPIGWDDGLKIGVNKEYEDANTLLILAGVIPEAHQGKGLSTSILQAFKVLASSYHFSKLVVPVRPTEKQEFPTLSIDEYCNKKLDNGRLFDNWLRVHERVGGRIIRGEEKSQLVIAPIDEWRKWIRDVVSEGVKEYFCNEALSKVTFNFEEGVGVYHDPCVWVEHTIDFDPFETLIISPQYILQHLNKFLPSYMIPHNVIIMNNLPKLNNEKIDKNKLKGTLESKKRIREIVQPRNTLEKEIKDIWLDTLKIEDISVKDNFYDVGGHSLLATVLLYKINERFNVNLMLKKFLENPYIEDIANYIGEEQGHEEIISIDVMNIKPVHDQNNDCFEDQVITLLNHFNDDYRLMPIYSWNFAYSSKTDEGIGSLINSGSDINDTIRSLQEIYSYKVNETTFEGCNEAIEFFEGCIKAETPLIIVDDAFYCPWDPNYQNYHDLHSCFVVGVDWNNRQLICTDAYNSMHNINYSFDDFEKGFKGLCYTFEKVGIGELLTTRNILEKLVEKLNSNDGRSSFEEMKLLAHDIHNIQVDLEIGGLSQVQHSEIYKNLYTIKRKRHQILSLLKGLDDSVAEDLILQFEKVTSLWDKIINTITKALMKPTSKILSRISSSIYEVAEVEEDIFNKINVLLIKENSINQVAGTLEH